ncbi:hypothetical protein MKW98_022939 [Papaver atlanticum]|uniref:Uncharacterized protein n=1 Tax=Papaver atlanticum TaxID=357466 RepID=A0AAD4TLZ5_9MAGN|nr:hypothetical protein MKW98_022939 [Papaver atlanticum]
MADYYQMRLEQLREELLELRGQLTALLNDWDPFLDGEGVIRNYLVLLDTTNPKIHETRSDVHVDLSILRALLPKLKDEYAEAEKEYFNAQLSNIYGYRKRSVMLRELQGVLVKKIPDELRKWIKRLLVDDEWADILRVSDEKEENLMRQARSKGISLTKQTIDPEQFKVDDDLDLVRDRFTDYLNGFTAEIRKTEEILCAFSDIPEMCQSVENLLTFLENTSLSFPDDSINEIEESPDVHH